MSCMRPFRLIAALMLVGVHCGCDHGPSQQVSDPRVARIWSTFRLAPPYFIVSVDAYLDGGSSRWVLRGANRHTLDFCFDGGMLPVGDSGTRLLYLGELRSQRAAVPLRSPRESTLVDLLQMTAEHRLSGDLITALDSIYRTGDAKGYRSAVMSQNVSGQRAMEAYLLSLGLRAQQVRGYWRTADDPL